MNWYLEQKEAGLKEKLKQVARPALMMAPLGVGLGLMPNAQPIPQQQQQVAPLVTQTPDMPLVTRTPDYPTKSMAPMKPTVPAKPTGKSNLIDMLKDHEGYSLTMYPDSRGIETIGIGYNLRKPGAREEITSLGLDYDQVLQGKQKITDQQARQLFNDDVQEAKADLQKVIPNLSSHPQNVQDVLTDMIFNLGVTRFSKFKELIDAVNRKDYERAAQEMSQSKWYGQVKRRGPKLVNLMKSIQPIQPPKTQML